MTRLSDLEADAQMEVPRAIGSALKAFANGAAGPEQQKLAYQFIVETLAGVNRLGFALPDAAEIMGWRQGRRFVGLQMNAIVAAPMEDETPPEPRPRTMTERQERRTRGQPPKG